jgi:transcriptional regulator with PAS, ATPase and Fis domain
LVESFIAANGQGTCGSGKSAKILIYDEIDFNNFYEKTDENIALLSFLETINADIFMPIYEKNNMTAYIIVERFARLNNFYGTTERDEMLVYASYLGNIINLFQTCNLDTLAQQEKELQDELYQKHQEINQYKESIRSFLRTTHDKEIGVIFYQNRRFIFGNKSARDFVQININAQEGHPISKALRHVARQVEEYKTPLKQFALDNAGNKLVLSGVPNLEKNNVIITMYYPEISDIIKKQTEHFNDPTKWDYLLYLETTESGKLINKLIPGSGETLLNFKIDLLKIALSKRAILLEMPTHDIMPTVEIIHHISLREQLHCLKLNSASRSNNETIIKIFGIDPLFSITVPKTSLLEELDNTGTLFIENVHLLSMEAQEYLTEFLKYGSFRMYKSNQKKTSTARIICSTNQNLQTLTHEGTFSKELFNILRKNTVSMPSLLTLADNELCELADGFTEQSLKSMPMKNLLELTNSEKNRLVHARPASIHELKEKVQHLLTQKSKRNMIEEETQFDPAYQFTDPHLMQAARLGKHALRDPKIMALLWNKFKSQSKIATFLGVNRSSVNRRCKDYHLITPEDESSD